jgi:restriction endonuclease Mrr
MVKKINKIFNEIYLSIKIYFLKGKNRREIGVINRAFREAEDLCLSLERLDTSFLEKVDIEFINNLKSIVESLESSLYSSLANTFLGTLRSHRETNEKDEPNLSRKDGEIAYTISDEDFAKIEPSLKEWEDIKHFYQAEYFNFREEIETTPKIFLEVLQTIENLIQRLEKEQRINLVKKRVSVFIEKVAVSKEILLSSNFSFMSPFDFEEFVAKLFNKMGYNTRTTSKTGDYGVDVIAENSFEKVAIQCKKYHEGNNVGNDVVQMLLGAMQLQGLKANKGIIVTTSRFTKQAYKQAEGNNLELWDKDILHQAVRKYLIGS